MRKIGFYIVKLWAYGVAFTPFALLYMRSDIIFFLVYHIARYRRKVVRTNLLNSFPGKTEKERKQIEKGFYHNLCDLAVEMCKMLVMRPEDIQRRVTFTNPELLSELYDRQRSVFVALPHSGNWEWLGKILHTATPHKCSAIYKRLGNEDFERFMYRLRTSYHLEDEQMIEANSAMKVLLGRREMCNAAIIVADQSPRGTEKDYWTDFLHQETCWFTGLERMAKMLDYAVVFAEMRRTKRGCYEVTFKKICDNANETEKGFVMGQYVRELERFIKENPDNWLWSHRRWKHSRPEFKVQSQSSKP